jgi:hypothetical protein
MCEVTTIMAVAGVVMSAYGSMQESKAQQNQANYQAAVANNNSIIANRNADAIQKQGDANANVNRRNVRDQIANQTVSLAAQGGDVTVGSNIDLLADQAEFGEKDSLQIEANARTQANNARAGGMNDAAQAGLFTAQANNINPGMAGATTLLSGAGSVASKWKTS